MTLMVALIHIVLYPHLHIAIQFPHSYIVYLHHSQSDSAARQIDIGYCIHHSKLYHINSLYFKHYAGYIR